MTKHFGHLGIIENRMGNQRDQIGRFLKVLDNKFCYKSSPNFWKSVGLFEKHQI